MEEAVRGILLLRLLYLDTFEASCRVLVMVEKEATDLEATDCVLVHGLAFAWLEDPEEEACHDERLEDLAEGWNK